MSPRPGDRRHDSPAVSIVLAINRNGDDTDWHGDALCAKNDPELWFHTATEADAIEICVTCPVRIECADYALRNREQYGVFGGLTADQRDRILARGAA
jgi:WhiB family transcriptional regulator, redox-sensing transcriptional regulator